MTETEHRYPCGCEECRHLFIWTKEIERDSALSSLIAASLDDMAASEQEKILNVSRALGVLSRLDVAEGFLTEWERGFAQDLGDEDEATWTRRQQDYALRFVKGFRQRLEAKGYRFADDVVKGFESVRALRKERL